MGMFSSRKQLEDIKFSVIVYLPNKFIMKAFVAVAVALLVSVVTVADATLVLKFECPSSAPKMFLTPAVTVSNYPSPAGARSVGGCCKEGFDMRTTAGFAWCCKKGTKGHCWGTQCSCDGRSDSAYATSITAPKVSVISKS